MRALKTVGYVISHKNGENRRALFPAQCTQLKFPEQAIFETGYGLSLGFSDADYERAGVKIASREEVLRADVIVDVKLGDVISCNIAKCSIESVVKDLIPFFIAGIFIVIAVAFIPSLTLWIPSLMA